VLRSRRQSEDNYKNAVEIVCTQYLTRVYQYVSCWVENPELAEELTLKALRKTLVKYRDFYRCENTFSIGVFAAARKEIQACFETSHLKPPWPHLSDQEREVVSLKLGARLDNQKISRISGLAESNIKRIINQSLCKLRDCLDVTQGIT
jgi:DNA-directed RNA polymerase specialized sigma subunit